MSGVRLVKLKKIPTHDLECIIPESFSFVKVSNRKVRPLDGDMPCDGKGVSRIYKNGSMYVRLNDDSIWMKKVHIYMCVLMHSHTCVTIYWISLCRCLTLVHACMFLSLRVNAQLQVVPLSALLVHYRT